MIHEIPLMRSLDPHQSRLGYLGVCAAVGVRSLDTYDALASRMSDLLYERLYEGEPAYAQAIEMAGEDAIHELVASRSDEENPAAILAPLNTSTQWITRSEGWLLDRRLPSHLGYLKPSHVGRAIDIARWTGVLLPTMDLSEEGLLLQMLVRESSDTARLDANPLFVQRRPALVMLYARLLLHAEVLFVSLLCEMVSRTDAGEPISTRGKDGLLRHAVRRLQAAVGEPADPEDFLAFRVLTEFQEAFLKTLSTEENYFRPRVEILVDLGLVSRKSFNSDKPSAFPWVISDVGRKIAMRWSALDSAPLTVDEFLEREFIHSMEPVLGVPLENHTGLEQGLAWFARAYKMVQREIGFTPGRTVATLASLLAAEAGVRLELSDLFDMLYAVPRSRYAEYVSFSGGSRFDQEFMIKIDPMLSSLLTIPSTTVERN